MPLQVMGAGPPYGLMRSETAFEAFQRMQEDPKGFMEDVYLTFDSKSDLEDFLQWWNDASAATLSG